MDHLIRSVKELKAFSLHKGSLAQFKCSKDLVEVCRRQGVVADIKDPSSISKSAFDDYFTHLCALAKKFLFEHRDLKVWSKFAAHPNCRKIEKIFHEFGVARSSGLFTDEAEAKYDPTMPDSKRVTLEELYEVYRIKFNFSGSLQAFKRQITRTYGSYAEYCLQKGYDINTTRWDMEETALRVAKKLGSLEAVEKKSTSLVKYLEEKKLTKLVFSKGADPKIRPLTKSRFKTGLECPTKLFFSARSEYGNKKDQDEFLKALADSGFQVGELAKLYHPGGVQVDTLDYKSAVDKTNDLLSQDHVTIFEAAIQNENRFVRVDILRKEGRRLHLIEVKAKSFDPRDSEFDDIFDKRKLKKQEYQLKGDWQEYLMDLAFQTHVTRSAFPDFEVIP